MLLERVERVYLRKNAIEKRELIDVTPVAEENGFSVCVAISKKLYLLIKKNIPEVTEKNCGEYDGFPLSILNQDFKGRLDDVLWMANLERSKDRNKGKKEFTFMLFLPHTVTVIKPNKVSEKIVTKTTLKLVKGIGDHGESVVTILLPDEKYIW